MALLSTTLIGQKPNGGDAELARKIARFAPTTLTADTSKLSPKDRQALDKIIAAAKLLDPLFLRQVWSGNDALEKKLQADKSAAGQQRLHYFYINDGPWSRLDEKEPFIDGVPRDWLDERLEGDAALGRTLETWRQAGLLTERGDRIALTESGFLVSDALFVELL